MTYWASETAYSKDIFRILLALKISRSMLSNKPSPYSKIGISLSFLSESARIHLIRPNV
jgi:hypothetical protein